MILVKHIYFLLHKNDMIAPLNQLLSQTCCISMFVKQCIQQNSASTTAGLRYIIMERCLFKFWRMYVNKSWIKLNHTLNLNEEFWPKVHLFKFASAFAENKLQIFKEMLVFIRWCIMGKGIINTSSITCSKKKLHRMIHESHFSTDQWMWLSRMDHFLSGKSNKWLGIMKTFWKLDKNIPKVSWKGPLLDPNQHSFVEMV